MKKVIHVKEEFYMRKNNKIKKVILMVVIITMVIFGIMSHLHVRIVAESLGESHFRTIEYHKGELYENKDVIYPYGKDHKINIWFTF